MRTTYHCFHAEQPGEVVERDTLLIRIWGERAVTDEPLTRCIAELRRAFGDRPKNPKHIQTIPERGYRLIAQVGPPSAGEEVSLRPDRQAWKGLFRIAGPMALVVAAYFSFSDVTRSPLPIEEVSRDSKTGAPSIAVLPFRNRSDDDAMEYFGVGVTEDIINLLATIPDLRVTSAHIIVSFSSPRPGSAFNRKAAGRREGSRRQRFATG